MQFLVLYYYRPIVVILYSQIIKRIYCTHSIGYQQVLCITKQKNIYYNIYTSLKIFVSVYLLKEKHVNLAHIESRRCKRIPTEVEIYAEFNCTKKEFNELVQYLKDHVNILSYNTPQHVWSADGGACLHCLFYEIWCPEFYISLPDCQTFCSNVGSIGNTISVAPL